MNRDGRRIKVHIILREMIHTPAKILNRINWVRLIQVSTT